MTYIDTTQAAVTVPNRGPVVGRMVVVLLLATVVAGVIASQMALWWGGQDPTDLVTAGDVPGALLMGALVGLAGFFILIAPAIITVVTTHAWAAVSDRRARLVGLIMWIVTTGVMLGAMWVWLGNDVGQALTLAWPSLLWTLLVVVGLAPWVVWGRLRRPRV